MVNTLSNIILNKIHNIVGFNSSTTFIHFIFTDIRHTTFSTYALLWDIWDTINCLFIVFGTSINRGVFVLFLKSIFALYSLFPSYAFLDTSLIVHVSNLYNVLKELQECINIRFEKMFNQSKNINVLIFRTILNLIKNTDLSNEFLEYVVIKK